MGILTPTESRQDIDMPVSGNPASAGSFASNVIQRLLNRTYMLERILDGYYNRAVNLIGAFTAYGTVILGNDTPTRTNISAYGNATFYGMLRTRGKVSESTRTVGNEDITSTVRRHFVYNTTLTANRTLVVDFEGSVGEGDLFTVWNNTNGTIYVNSINPEINQLGMVLSNTHQTCIANDSGTMIRMLS